MMLTVDDARISTPRASDQSPCKVCLSCHTVGYDCRRCCCCRVLKGNYSTMQLGAGFIDGSFRDLDATGTLAGLG